MAKETTYSLHSSMKFCKMSLDGTDLEHLYYDLETYPCGLRIIRIENGERTSEIFIGFNDFFVFLDELYKKCIKKPDSFFKEA